MKITVDRKVIERALEVLQEATTYTSSEVWLYSMKRDCERAITALRAALEKPEQEPVGWFESPYGAFRANPLHKIKFPSELPAWQIPVYITPPQRKPLTDEEIEFKWEEVTGHSIFGGDRKEGRGMFISPDEVTEFARAIEAAHGIKE